jgi:hypothetical protein
MMHVASPLSTNRHNIPKDTSTFIVCTVDKRDNETLHCQLDWHRVFSNGSANNTWQSQVIIRLAAKFDLSKLISHILTSTQTELEMPQSLPDVISD